MKSMDLTCDRSPPPRGSGARDIFQALLGLLRVKWHLNEAWRGLALLRTRTSRPRSHGDPVARPALRRGARQRALEAGSRTTTRSQLPDVMSRLSAIVATSGRAAGHKDGPTFELTTTRTRRSSKHFACSRGSKCRQQI